MPAIDLQNPKEQFLKYRNAFPDPVRGGGVNEISVALWVLLDRVRDEILGVLDLRVVPTTTHEALDRINGVAGVRDRLTLGGVADQSLAGFRKCDHRRSGAFAL